MANSHLVRAAIRVRGLGKVKCVMLIFALAHNLMRMAALAPDFIGIATGTSGIPGLPL